MFIDRRHGGTPRVWSEPPEDFGMRVPDQLLKCVVFIGIDVLDSQTGTKSFKLGGTGFIVSVPAEKVPDMWFCYLVTAKHSVDKIAGRPFGVKANTTDGQSMVFMSRAGWKWWFHPTEEDAVDVAVTPWRIEPHEDIIAIPVGMFLTDDVIHEHHIGCGDEVFIMGLFSFLHGNERNISLVRIGNLAMMPGKNLVSGRLSGRMANIEAYLIEARSIGGLSGSPAFVRENVLQEMFVKSRTKTEKKLVCHSGDFYLLGLMHGHWSTLPENKNEVEIIPETQDEDRVNLGIAIVVPAKKILEVINQPKLIEERRRLEAEHAQAHGAGMTEQD